MIYVSLLLNLIAGYFAGLAFMDYNPKSGWLLILLFNITTLFGVKYALEVSNII